MFPRERIIFSLFYPKALQPSPLRGSDIQIPQIPPPKTFDFFRQIQLVQFLLDVVEIEGANIFRPATRQRLAQQPALLERVAQIERVRAPYKVTGRMYDHLSQDITTIQFGFGMLNNSRAEYTEAKMLILQVLSSSPPAWHLKTCFHLGLHHILHFREVSGRWVSS